MEKFRRIFALAAVVFLLGMYAAVLFLGLTADPAAQGLLMAAIGCTIVIPVLLYGMMLVSRVFGNKDSDQDKKENDQDGPAA